MNNDSHKEVRDEESLFGDLIASQCVVPENIQTPTTEGIGNSEGVGGSMAQEIPKGRGVSRPNSLPDGREND